MDKKFTKFFKTYIKGLLSKNIDKTFYFITNEINQSSPWYNQFVQIKTRHTQYTENNIKDNDIQSNNDVILNRILNSIISSIDDIENVDIKDAVKLGELEAYVDSINSKISRIENAYEKCERNLDRLFDAIGRKTITTQEAKESIALHDTQTIYKNGISIENELYSKIFGHSSGKVDILKFDEFDKYYFEYQSKNFLDVSFYNYYNQKLLFDSLKSLRLVSLSRNLTMREYEMEEHIREAYDKVNGRGSILLLMGLRQAFI